jgi:hypothetical protein
MRPDAARAHLEAIRALGVEGRLRVAESLRAFAWELQATVIAERHPALSKTEVLELVREAFRRGVFTSAWTSSTSARSATPGWSP